MDWLRLWHDMPTDPKWRTIARRSGQSTGNVMAVYNFLLVNASENDAERGRLRNWDSEVVSVALDIEPEDVEAIMREMQGRVLDGDRLTGWEKRQPKREDGSAERTKQYRERKRSVTQGDTVVQHVTQCDARERSVTQCDARERSVTQCDAPDTDTDTDTDTEKNSKPSSPSDSLSALGKAVASSGDDDAQASKAPKLSKIEQEFEEDWPKFWIRVGKGDAKRAYIKARKSVSRADLMAAVQRQGPHIIEQANRRRDGTPVHPATWLNGGRWADELDAKPAILWGDE